jgi:hypothetical protein
MTRTDFSQYDPEIPMYCANHPDTQTFLRCGKCEKPICARCRVSTPVGFRCYDCANMQVVPTYAVSTDYYVKAALMGGLAAAIIGALMGIFPGFEFWAALIMGIAVPEAVAAAANQKRGPGLRAVAIGAIIFGFVLSRVVLKAFPGLLLLGGINYPSPGGISWLDNLPIYVTQYTILWLAMAILLAYQRLR